jgi:hypothetical protein
MGRESLHATAINSDRGACAFIAPAGTGKSTIAASFQMAGHRLICDDCLVLDTSTDCIAATPGYPGVRLWQDSLDALGASRSSASRVADYSPKWRLSCGTVAASDVERPIPLVRIYLLARDAIDAPRLERVSSSEAFPHIIGASFPLDITDPAMLERHFRLFSRVSLEVPVRRLTIPSDFASLPETRRLVLRDLEESI